MAITGLADLGDTIPTILARAHFQEDFDSVMRSVCWNYKSDKGTTTNIPYWGKLTAAKLTEKVDMISSESIVDTNVQITPYEAGLKTILTYNAIEDDNEDMKSVAGRLMGSAFETLRDSDLLGQMDDATVSLAGAGTTLTMGHVAAGRATLVGNTAAGGKAPMPFVCVIHPNQELDIVDVLTPLMPFGVVTVAGTALAGMQAMAGGLAEEAMRHYSVGRLFGIPILVDGNLTIDASDDAKGGIFSSGEGGGIIYVEKRAPEIKPDDDPSMRGVELNYVGRYGVGEYLAGWIVELYTDAAAPA